MNVECGEGVYDHRPNVSGKSKLGYKYKEGIWSGHKAEPNESSIRAEEGVIKGRSAKGESEETKLFWGGTQKVERGAFWEPFPSRSEFEVVCSVRIPQE